MLGNVERIGDHAINIAEYTQFMKKWEIRLTEEEKEDVLSKIK